MAWMVAANYFSAIAGVVLSFGAGAVVDYGKWEAVPLHRAFPVILGFAIVSFPVTVLVELPFTRLVQAPDRRTWWRAVKMSVVAQTASYLILVPWYLSSSYMSVITETQVRRDVSFARPPLAWVYYINPNGDVWRVKTDGTQRAWVLDAELKQENSRLAAQKSPEEDTWDLCAVLPTDYTKTTTAPLKAGFAALAGLPEYRRDSPSRDPYREPDLWSDWGPAADLRMTTDPAWCARTGFWSSEGITIYTTERWNPDLRISLETPVVSWATRSATVLPSGQIVYQLGPQVVLFDPETRDLGVLAVGRGPVVGFDELPAVAEPQTK
jgi:hypothetical protein